MSLGGLVALVVAHERPDLVAALVLIDITPGVNADKARHILDFVNGPPVLRRLRRPARAHGRPQPDALGVVAASRHLAQRAPASRRLLGLAPPTTPRGDVAAPDAGDLWDRLAELDVPVTLFARDGPGLGRRRRGRGRVRATPPDATIVRVADAGHSVQGDQPLELAALLLDATVLGVRLAGGGGLEPPTYGFKVRRSAN